MAFSAGRVTRVGPSGFARAKYGSFAGKSITPTPGTGNFWDIGKWDIARWDDETIIDAIFGIGGGGFSVGGFGGRTGIKASGGKAGISGSGGKPGIVGRR